MKSIRRHLTLRLVTGCALLWAVCGAGIYLAVRGSLLREFDRALLAKAQAMASLIEQRDDGSLALNLADEWMPIFSRKKASDYFQLWNARGGTVERSDSLGKSDLPRRAGPQSEPVFWNLSLPDRNPGRAIGIRFRPPAEEEDERRARGPEAARGEAILVVASNRAETDHFLTLLGALLLGSEALVLAGTGLVATFAVRRGLAPLALVAERARAIDAEVPGTRFPTSGMPEELRPICVRLNDSLARLERSFERERQFSSDAAHELRTPIAELRSLAEVALKWPGDAEAAGQSLRDALEIALQMETIVTRLLALMRSESGAQAVRREPVDVARLMERSWMPLKDAAAAKGLRVAFHLPAGVLIESDPGLLQGIFGNLLSNAVVYTPAGGAVEVDLRGPDDAFAIRFANTTEELTPQDVPHLFERYWRKDSARHAAAHSGLGLPLARAFARALGMRLDGALGGSGTLEMVLSDERAGVPAGEAADAARADGR